MSKRIEKSVSDGPSTSSQLAGVHAVEVGGRQRVTLDKPSFVDRVARRAALRYGQDFTGSHLDDLIKGGLVDEALRLGTEGQRPIYRYDFTSYRRALQILRFRQLGITSRNDIRLMLFVRCYGFPARKVGEVLLHAHDANSRKLVNQIRSSYADNTKPIPGKHRASLLVQMGQLDETLDAGALKFHSDTIIDMFRVTKQGAIIEVTPPEVSRNLFRYLFAANSPLVAFGRKVFSGFLNVGDDDSPHGAEVDTVARLIRHAKDSDLQNARHFHGMLVRLCFWLAAHLRPIAPFSKGLAPALSKVAISVRDSPKWAALIMVVALRLLQFDMDFGNVLSRSRKHQKVRPK